MKLSLHFPGKFLRSSATSHISPWIIALVVGFCGEIQPTAHAQTNLTWDGSGADDNWSTAANWGGTGLSGNEILNFGGSIRLAPVNDVTGYGGYRILFNAGAGAFTLSGNALSLFDFGGGAPKIENNSSNVQTINNSLTLQGIAGSGVEINPVDGSMIFGGGITLSGAGNSNLKVFGNNGNMVTFNGVIGESGTNGFSLLLNSIAVFGATNTYTGTTLIDAGTLRLASGGSITTSDILVGNGALFDVNGQTATVKSISEQGSGDGGSIRLGSGSLTVNNAGAGTKYFKNLGVSGDTGSFVLNSTGSTLELYGNSAFTGATTVQAGTLKLQSGVTMASSGYAVSGGAISVPFTNGQAPLGAGAISLNGGSLVLNPTANVSTQGLSGRQFSVAGVNDTARIDFTGTALSTRTDSVFTLTQANNLAAPAAVQWTGKLNVITGGSYTFTVGSDDGSRLWIDGVLVVQNDGSKGVATGTSAGITLSSGLHDVRVDYVNGSGNGNMNLLYAGPDQPVQGTIPAAKLFTAETNAVGGASNAVVLGSGIGNALNVAGNSTVALTGSAFTQAQVGNLVLSDNATLNLTSDSGQIGKALRIGGMTTFGNANTLNLVGDGTNGANLYLDGALSDGGVARTITKSGLGRLYLGQTTVANNLTSGTVLDVTAGALVATGTSASGSFNPLGAATVKLSGGNLVLDSKVGSLTTPTVFNNNIQVTANATIQDISSGGSLMTLGSSSTTIDVATGTTLTLDAIAGGNPVASLGAALTVAGSFTGSGNVTLASTKVGTLTIAPVNGTINFRGNNSGFTGTTTIPNGFTLNALGTQSLGGTTVLSGGTLALLNDGTGTPNPETISYNASLSFTAPSFITVGRQGSTFAPLFPTAVNKTIQLPSLTTGGQPLSVNNNNGYGLAISGTTTLSGTENFNVSSISNTGPFSVHGFYLDGKVTGTTTGGITKAGSGTMVLSNATNDFVGNLTVTGGVLAATSDTALGNAANSIILNGGASQAFFEALGTFSTARSLTFNSTTTANNVIAVSRGNTLTITSALTGTNGFQKGDPGTLVLTNNTSSISGAVVASGGVLRITQNGALGTATSVTVPNNEGSTFQLDGSGGALNFARPLTLNNTGIFNNGALENYAGSNTVSGAITLGTASTIGNSAAGTTLTLTGGISGAFGLTFNGVGNSTISTTALGAVSGLTVNGAGTTTLAVASPLFVAATATNGATLVINGAGSVGNGAVASTITSGGTLWVDDTGTANPTRFGSTRTITLNNGTFRYSANGTAASTQALGTLTSNWGGNVVRIDNAGAGASTVTFAGLASNVVAGGSTLLFQSGATGAGPVFGSATNKVVFTAAPTLTNGIIQRAVVWDATGGSADYNFATNGANGIAAYAAYNVSNNANSALATDNLLLTASANTSLSRTLNAIASSGSGRVLNGTSLQTLTLTSGNILVKSGSLTIGSNLVLASGGTEMGLNVAPGATLDVNAPMTSSNNVTVGLGGTINLNTKQYFNTGGNVLTINAGTVKLAGGNGTLFAGQGLGANQNLVVGPGATLDLNGTVQTTGYLQSPGSNGNAFFGSGGIVTSTGGAATLVSRQANSNWGGQITGPVTFVMGNTTAANVERFYQDNTYTGRTLVTGAILELTDYGRLSGTSAIDLNYGSLNLVNSSANNGRQNLTDRIPDATPINLSGGAIVLTGRAQSATTETLGTVKLMRGNSNIIVNAASVGIFSTELTITSLLQDSPDAVTNVQNANGQVGSGTRIFLGNGTALMSNNILPVWIESGGSEFMTYSSTLGAMALSAAGSPGYDGTTLPTVNNAGTAVGNYRIGATGTVPTGGLTVNTLNVNGAFSVNFGTTTSTDVLNIGASGFIKSGATGTNIGSVVDEGRLTAGGASPSGTVPLYLFNAISGNSLTVNSRIIDNGASPLRLVVNNFNGGTIVIPNGNNSYTGGTVVNGWINNSTGGLSITGSGKIPAGGLTINSSTVVTSAAGQINSANTVNLNASSTLTLVGNNVLQGLVIDNYGGLTAPTVNTGGTLNLTNGLTASSNNVSTLPVINGTLDFGGGARTFTINPISYDGVTLNALQPTLNINGIIQNAGAITKAGNGLLQLSGQSTFSGGINLTAGGLVINANSTPQGGTVTSGPLGTGTLTASAGTTLLAGTASTVANNLTLLGNLNFDGLNNLTFTGTTTLPASPVTINVAAPQQTVGLLGAFVNPTTNITKTGYGTLNLSSDYSGTLTLAVGGIFGLADDGTGTGTPEDIVSGMTIDSVGATTVNVGRTGVDYAPYFSTASNKTFKVANLTTGGGSLTVNNNNGYGLDITGTQVLAADQTYTVTNASASNVVPGLTLNGVVSGAFNVVKTGSGTMVLGNSGNTVGGAGKIIDIQGGVVAAATDGAFGDASTAIKLNVAGTTAVGLRATGTFATSRTINLAQATNAIEVTAGNELTINSAFTGLSANSQLVKNDNGTLTLNSSNTTWSGSITAPGGVQVLTGGLLVNAGVVKITNGSALGATSNIVAVNSTSGAQVQIGGGITVPNALVLNTINAAGYFGGINGSGALRSIGNGVTNTWSGAISENQDAGITADSGNILNLTGGINLNAHIGIFGGAGTINVTTGAITAVHTIDKIGSGTTNIQVATAAPTGNGIRVYAGALTFSGAGAVSGAGTLATFLNPGGTINLDSSGTVTPNRLGGRAITFNGGNLNMIGGATATGEAIGAPTFNRGQTTITVTAAAGGANLTFTAGSNNVNPAQTTGGSGASGLFRGTSLGTAAAANVATIAWTTGGLGFNGGTGATNTNTKGLVPWALIDTSATGLGTSFVTADSAALATNTGTAFLRPLNASEYAAGSLANLGNMLVTTALSAQPTTLVNSLTFDTGGSLTMGSTNGVGNAITSSSGGILVRNGVTASISGGIVSIPAANSALNVHTPGTASLTINSLITGGQAASAMGLIKADGGMLTLSTPKSTLGGLTNVSLNTLNMQTVVNQGTLKLNGGTNTLGANNYLEVSPGGILDLNGTSQYVLGLFTDGTSNGVEDTATAGGTITSTSAATLVTNSDARNWAGQITGNVFYNRTGTVSTTTIYTPQTYTGGTLINGGTVSLRDYGKLTGTSAIDLNYAALALDNTQAAGVTGRLGTAPVTMRGGILNYTGRAQTASTETIGSVNIAEGWNSISVTSGGTGVNSADLTIAELLHTGGSAGVVNFANANGGVLENGQIGNSPRLLITSSPTLANNIIAPWAIVSRDWASYIPTLGLGALNATGFSGYATTNIATGSATDNVRLTASPAVLTANATIGTLNFNYSASITLDLGTKTLTLAGGGLILGSGGAGTGSILNGNLTSGASNVGGDFYTHFLPYAGTGRLAVIGANITDNGSGPVRFILSSSEISGTAQTVTLNGANTYTGGTVLNLGTTVVGATGTLPAGGITLNSATLSQAIAAQATPGTINSANVVTINGPSTLNLVNNNTLAGLVFNNSGATSMGAGATSANINPTVNTSIGGVGTNGRGILTIGASGIVANSSNVATTSSIAGRLDMSSSANTITVNPITVNGVNVAPLQSALAISGFTGSAGGITKNGNGVLQLNAQSTFTGALNVTAGGVNMGLAATSGLAGTSQPGSRYSALTLSANTWLNLNNTDAVIGSLAGAGNVINATPSGAVASGRTLNVGFDSTDTSFSGSFARWSDQMPNAYQVNKIGSGTMTLTGSSNITNTLQVSQGGVTFAGAGNALFSVYTVLPSATLTLDNSSTNVQHRLGGSLVPALGTLNISGGDFRIVGSGTTNTLENIATVNMGTSSGNLYGNPTLTLVPNAGFSISLSTNTFGGIPVGSSSLIRGVSATPSAGTAIFNIGGSALGSPAGSGTGASGTTTMGIRPDILGDVSPTGLGTAFIVKDTVNNTLRPLTNAEMATSISSGFAGTTVNYALSSAFNNSGRTTLGSVALNSGGGIAQDPVLSSVQPDGLPISTVVNTGGILAFTGNTGITTGRLETNNNTYLHLHTLGDLTISSVIFGGGGLTKGDAGTLTLTARNLYTGQTTINTGTIVLNGGDNTLPNVATTLNGPTTVLDLNGTNQIVGTFGNNGSARYAGGGGTLTNSSLTPSTFTTSTGSAQIFSGAITGNLSFNKTGNNSFTLSNANTYTGVTNLRANTTTLIDAGTLSGTSAVNVYYAALSLDQSGLNPIGDVNPTRIPAATPLTLRGSTLTFTSGGSADYSQTFNTLNVSQGHNTLSVPNAPAGATGALNIGNLVISPDATLNVTGGGSSFFNVAPGNGISNLYFTSINGSAIPATITGKILPANIITNNGEFTAYVQAGTTGSNGQNYGIVTMNGLGAISQTQYETNVTSGATLPASNALANVRTQVAGAANLPAGGANYNVLALRTAGITLTFAAAADVLNLTAGGLALTGNTAVVGSAVGNGTVTAGGTATGTIPLYVHNTGAIFNSAITNNASGGIVRLVANTTANTLTLAGVNTYTGGTVVNGGTVALSGAGTIPAGGLTINGGTVTTTGATAENQIASTNDVVLNGSSTLTLGNFANTLKSLTFNNTGGTGNPTVTISNTSLTLTDTSAITVVNDNIATNPVISGNGALTLPAGANINVSSTNQVPIGLTISSPLASAGAINKIGSGALDLTIAGTFTGGFNVNAGTLLLGVSSTPTTGTVTSGPVGTGTLTLADGTALASDVAIRTIANAVTINGNVTFGALSSASSVATNLNGIVLNGPVSLGAAANRTINVNSLLNVSTIGGIISGSGSSLTKTGPGTLVLTGVNTYNAGTNINGGVVQTNVSGVGSSGSITFGGGILRHHTATTTDFSSRISTANNQPIYIDTNNQSITYASALTSATGGSLGKFGTGTLILTNTATYDGATIINEGTLQVGNGGTTGNIPTATNVYNNGVLSWNRSNDDSLTGVISGAGAITKFGSRVLALSGVNTFTGNVTMNVATPTVAGAIKITNSQALGLGTKNVTIVSNNPAGVNAAQLLLDGTSGPIVLGSNLSFVTSQASTLLPAIVNQAGNNIINGNFTLTSGGGSTSIASDGGDLTLNGNLTPNTTSRDLILLGSSTGTVNGLVADGASPNFLGLVKQGTGTWTLANANTYTQRTLISDGTLSTNLLANGGVNSGIGASTNAAANLVFDGGTLKYTGASVSTDRNFTITAAKNATIDISTAATNLTMIGAAPATTGGLTKAGAGTLKLTAAQIYTGATNINGGTLALGGSGALADTIRLNLTASGTVFDIEGITAGTEILGSATGVAGSVIKLSTHTLDLGGDNTSFSVASDISGSTGSVTKSGTGTMTMGGNNTYTGSTNVAGGTLLLATATALPSTATLNLSTGTTLSTGGFSQSTGALSVNGTAPTTGAVIDMAGGDAALTFANVGTWTGLLSVWNYTGAPWTLGTDKLSFTSGSGSINLATVQFYSDSGSTVIGSGGGGLIGNELVPVPEASTATAALLLLGTLGFRERRRFLHYRK